MTPIIYYQTERRPEHARACVLVYIDIPGATQDINILFPLAREYNIYIPHSRAAWLRQYQYVNSTVTLIINSILIRHSLLTIFFTSFAYKFF